jgi:predicted amidohydrolase
MYNTLLAVSREGRVVGWRRKLMPTHSERVYWGMGDRADIRVFPMDVGTVGGLICYEHHMTLLRAAMAEQGEELHVAVWPGWWAMERHLGAKRAQVGAHTCDIDPAIREYAIANSVFVVSCSWYLPREAIPADLADVMNYNLAIGGSCIVNPSGLFVREPVFETETIVWAEIDQEERRLAKAYFDVVGHYVRRDLLGLEIRGQNAERGRPDGPEPPVLAPGPRRDDEEGQQDTDGAEDHRDAEGGRRRPPRRHVGVAEDGRAQPGRCQQDGREDRRECPVVADAAQEGVGLQALVLPPEPDQIGSSAPEPGRVVPLEEPPTPDRGQHDDYPFVVGRGEIRGASQLGHHGVGQQHVAGPDDGREPAGDEGLPADESALGSEDDCEPEPAVPPHEASRASGTSASRSIRSAAT